MKKVIITQPLTQEEFEEYYFLRWEILRKPWGQPLGSELDELEDEAVHLMAIDEQSNVIGVCRLHFIDEIKGQIRFMAVKDGMHGKGIGELLLDKAEETAKATGRQLIFLQSRENAVGFYQRHGYKIIEKTFRLYDVIQHFSMEKQLN